MLRVVSEELGKPVPKFIEDIGLDLASHRGVVAVLFYGNVLRDTEAIGLIDYYVLTESDSAYHGYGLGALINRLLPPNVYHEAFDDRRAKVAAMSLSAFAHRMRRDSWDTTLWTRFSQPTRLIYVKEAARDVVYSAIAEGWRTAAFWADALIAAEHQRATSRWAALFTQTYNVELRPEGGRDRASRIVETSPDLFNQIDSVLPVERLSPEVMRNIFRGWRWRRAVGKPLNILRLLKAAITFRGGADYALSKLERHTNGQLVLKPWERRYPWLAAPWILVRLLKFRR